MPETAATAEVKPPITVPTVRFARGGQTFDIAVGSDLEAMYRSNPEWKEVNSPASEGGKPAAGDQKSAPAAKAEKK